MKIHIRVVPLNIPFRNLYNCILTISYHIFIEHVLNEFWTPTHFLKIQQTYETVSDVIKTSSVEGQEYSEITTNKLQDTTYSLEQIE